MTNANDEKVVRPQRPKKSALCPALVIIICAGAPLFVCEIILYVTPANAVTRKGDSSDSLPQQKFATLLERLDREKDQRSTWAYAALVGVVALSVVKRPFGTPWTRGVYALLASAGAFLIEAIRAGDLYERRAAGAALADQVPASTFNVINDLLRIQVCCLNAAVIVLLIFVSVFLTAIISGKVDYAASD